MEVPRAGRRSDGYMGVPRKGMGTCPGRGGCHRLGAKVKVRRPRASVRPREVLVSRGRAGALLLRLSLHRSPWQHMVTAVPLLTWSGLYLGVHESTHSFSTRFPDRDSTGDKGMVRLGGHL